ncbi:MAG: SHOCT domain-containing protein [Solirubrobacteraceae bacterium]
MMHMGYGFPWPLAMLAVMVIVALVMMGLARVGLRRVGQAPRCGPGSARRTAVEPSVTQAGPDPLVILRDRYARGEIDIEEFERRVDGLLRTEPDQMTGRVRP